MLTSVKPHKKHKKVCTFEPMLEKNYKNINLFYNLYNYCYNYCASILECQELRGKQAAGLKSYTVEF